MDSSKPAMGVPQILRLILVLILLALAGWLVYLIRQTLLPFGIAFVLSYILMPIVDRLESRGMNRVFGVVVIYAVIIAGIVLASRTFVPIMVGGVSNMKVRILGEKAIWPCVVKNLATENVQISRVESTHPDFDVLQLPVVIEVGHTDTLQIEFDPSASESRIGLLSLHGKVGASEQNVVLGRFHLSARGKAETNMIESKRLPTGSVTELTPIIELADSIHQFERLEPGYLSLLEGEIKQLQPQLQETFPMLKGIDLAEELNQRAQAWATELLKKTPALVGSLLSGITSFVIVPIVGFFFLIEGRAIKRAFIELIPNRYFEMVLNLLHRIDIQLGGYIRGLVLSVIIISMLSIGGLRIVGLNDYLVVGTIAGLANVIPYLGPIIGIVAGVLAALLQYSALSWGTILPVVGVFMFVQIMDNVFVAPVVVARSVNLHPLVVIFVVLVGNHLFGAVGMLLAVPTTAIVKVSAQTIYEGLRSYSVT
jgi:predicted PurR-regulated permease PerM